MSPLSLEGPGCDVAGPLRLHSWDLERRIELQVCRRRIVKLVWGGWPWGVSTHYLLPSVAGGHCRYQQLNGSSLPL